MYGPHADKVANGPTDEQKKGLDGFLDTYCKSFAYQEERGDKSGNRHFQICFCLIKKLTWNNLYKNILCKKYKLDLMWVKALEKKKGSPQVMMTYCMKKKGRVAGPWHKGFLKGQGERTDIKETYALIKEGKPFGDVVDHNPALAIRSFSGLSNVYNLMAPKPPISNRSVYVHFGASGTGKTSSVYSMYPAGSVYTLQPPNAKSGAIWWDDYDPRKHKTVLIDEFYGWIPIGTLLVWIDRHTRPNVQRKGGSVEMCAERIILCSNVPWRRWYHAHFQTMAEHIMAVHRRITEVREFSRVTTVGDEDIDTIEPSRKYKVVDPYSAMDYKDGLPIDRSPIALPGFVYVP